MIGDAKALADIIPVDLVVNAMVGVAWYTATHKPRQLQVYNLTTGDQNPFTWGEMRKSSYKSWMEKKKTIKYCIIYRDHLFIRTPILQIPKGSLFMLLDFVYKDHLCIRTVSVPRVAVYGGISLRGNAVLWPSYSACCNHYSSRPSNGSIEETPTSSETSHVFASHIFLPYFPETMVSLNFKRNPLEACFRRPQYRIMTYNR